MNEDQIKFLLGFIVIVVLVALLNGSKLEDTILGIWNGAVSLIGLILIINTSTDKSIPVWKKVIYVVAIFAIATILFVN